MKLYINTTSEKQLERLAESESQSLLLTGQQGIGLLTISKEIFGKTGKRLYIVYPEKDSVVDIDHGVIGVDSIRRLYNETRLYDPTGRVVIIDKAERMGIQAQNAFLKLLEEPNDDTTFVLLTHNEETLLPTITSRTQHVSLRPISPTQSEELLNDFNVEDITFRSQLLFIANGLPAELIRLINDTQLFEKRSAIIRDARQFLKGSHYEKLLIAKQYKDSRDDALVLLQDAMKLLRISLLHHNDDDTQSITLLNTLEETHRRIREQGNIRVQLSLLAVI